MFPCQDRQHFWTLFTVEPDNLRDEGIQGRDVQAPHQDFLTRITISPTALG